MAVFTQERFLSTARINRIIGTLASELEIQRPLVYLDRLPMVNAFDDELVGRFTGKIIAADIIADDQMAVVNESMQLELITHAIPNVKRGERLGQHMLNRLKQWEEGLFRDTQGENRLREWEMQVAENLVLGVRHRLNFMAAGMMLDDMDYSRFGIHIDSATWGMPAALKVTVSTPWSTAASATPLSDIWAIDQVARLTYGVEFDTITMSTANFRQLVATTEFANKASIPLQAHFLVTSVALPTKDDPQMMNVAGKILGKTIVLDDAIFYEKTNAGGTVSTRYLPENKVLLSRSQDHGSGNAYDMANGVVTESIVADMIGGAPEGIGGNQYGPIGYYSGRPDLNPPDITAWAVARCFPRKHVPESTAVLTVA